MLIIIVIFRSTTFSSLERDSINTSFETFDRDVHFELSI